MPASVDFNLQLTIAGEDILLFKQLIDIIKSEQYRIGFKKSLNNNHISLMNDIYDMIIKAEESYKIKIQDKDIIKPSVNVVINESDLTEIKDE
jgi:hypothetical protein